MRNLNELNQYRDCTWEMRVSGGSIGDGHGGCFKLIVNETELRIMASTGEGWDHISISTATRCPTWEEMEQVRKLFAKPHEVYFQLGLPAKDHINCHPYCLHWWRHQHREIKLPPSIMVAPKS